MRTFYLVILPIVLLISCSFSEEELLKLMVANPGYEEDCFNVYIVFESEETVFVNKVVAFITQKFNLFHVSATIDFAFVHVGE